MEICERKTWSAGLLPCVIVDPKKVRCSTCLFVCLFVFFCYWWNGANRQPVTRFASHFFPLAKDVIINLLTEPYKVIPIMYLLQRNWRRYSASALTDFVAMKEKIYMGQCMSHWLDDVTICTRRNNLVCSTNRYAWPWPWSRPTFYSFRNVNSIKPANEGPCRLMFQLISLCCDIECLSTGYFLLIQFFDCTFINNRFILNGRTL